MRKKMAVMLSIVALLTFTVPTAAFATTYNNGVFWEYEANDIITYANTFLGTPYLYGAKYGRTDRFDCSSFVKWVYRNYIVLPRVSRDQAKVGKYVPRSQLRKGDLVFFRSAGSSSNRITHVAIYAGGGKILHTYGAGGVRYSNLSGSWSDRYVTARRVLQ